jgi:hypothetical protein
LSRRWHRGGSPPARPHSDPRLSLSWLGRNRRPGRPRHVRDSNVDVNSSPLASPPLARASPIHHPAAQPPTAGDRPDG